MIKFKLLSKDRTWTLGNITAGDRDEALSLARQLYGSGITRSQIIPA